MRRMMWFTIGFAAACAFGAYLYNGEWLIPLLVFFLLAAVGIGMIGREKTAFRWLAMVCLGCALGLTWFLAFRQNYLLSAIALDQEITDVTVTATDYSFETDYGTGVDGILELEGRPYQIRLYINEEKSIEPGDIISGQFRLRVTTPDSANDATYHQGKGIFLLGYQKGTVVITDGNSDHWRFYPAVWRHKVKEIIGSCFPEDTVSFAKALLLGDSSGLDYETETSFRISGIRHIIAVSGLHVSILFGLLSRVTFKKRYLTAILGIPVLLFFAAVVGFTPSVTRACIMVGLMMLATAVNREYDGPTALAFAVLVMLILNPMVITNIGFQLSVASVAGIFLFSSSIREWLKGFLGEGKGKSRKARLNRWFCGSVSVTLSAISLTTPLCAYYFGAVSLIGIVTNLLTLWAVSGIFYGIIGVIVLYYLSFKAASFLAAILSWLIRYVLTAAKVLAGIPLAAVYTKSIYIVFWLIFVYILLAVFLTMGKKRPAQMICCGTLGLCLALLCAWAEPLSDECRVTVLDVGQGQSIILQSEGRTWLVDCGGDREDTTADIVAETLLSQGITRLDGVILTHYDNDHAGALENLLTRIDADHLYLPDMDGGACYADDSVIWVSDDLLLTFGGVNLSIFGPIHSGSSNENSLCVLFETENCAILITGDRSEFGEGMLLRQRDLPDVDLLIAGHHGSKYSTSEELLSAVNPETVIISVGENSYGHPADAVLQRLAEFGCTVYRTDLHGTIIFRR